MNICMRIFATLGIALVCHHAGAIPTLKRVTPTFYQINNGNLNAGLVVEASTDLLVLYLAGGFTISCSSSPLQHRAERMQGYTDFFGPEEVLQVPSVLPSTYAIPGWSSIPAGTCGSQCLMQFKGEARDETSLSVRIGSAGAGVTFGLIPAGQVFMGNSILTNICRSGRPQCCTKGCFIP